MSRVLKSEWRKLFSTKIWWGMLLGALFFTALETTIQIATNGLRRNPVPPLTAAVTQRSLMGSAASGSLLALIVGIIIVTTEFRHFTSRPTFLNEPRRALVIGSKLVIAAVVGLIYGVASVALTLAISVPWLSAKGVTIDWGTNDLVLQLFVCVVVDVIYTVVGIGVGVLIRNQVAAIILALIYLFVVETLVEGLGSLLTFFADIYKFLPGAAEKAVTQIDTRDSSGSLLNPWQGALVLIGWGLLFAVLGWMETVRRDIP